MAYSTINDPSAQFQVQLYTGTGSTLNVVNGGNANLQPDFVWLKNYGTAGKDYGMFDTNRGTTKTVSCNNTSAEATNANTLTAFSSDGFTLGSDGGPNANSSNNVAWQWKANGGTTVANNEGSLTNTIQVNSAAGLSIMTFNVGSSTGTTLGHGLGVIPSFFIAKNRDATGGWYGMFPKIWGGNQSAGINTTNGFGTVSGFSNFTSTLFTQGAGGVGYADDWIAYAWKPIKGYSAFGTYKSNNNADGPKIFTGFRPALVLAKNTGAGTNWRVSDDKRNGFNPENNYLLTNSNNAEDTSAVSEIEFLSNGFKLTQAEGDINYNTDQILYAAWAEFPSCFSDGVPAVAR